MITRKQTVLISSLLVLVSLLALILVRGIISPRLNRQAVNTAPKRVKNVEGSQSAAAQKLAESHKRLNLEERKNMKLEIMTFMHLVVLEAGAYKEGIAAFERLIQENPSNKSICRRAYNFIVRYHIENGNYKEAMGQAKILIDKYPTCTEAFVAKLNIGLCNEKTSQWEEAKEMYKSLAENLTVEIEQDETDKGKISIEKRARLGLSYFRLGRCLFNQEEYEKAINQFQQAFTTMEGIENWPSIRISPKLYDDFAEALYLMGQSYQKLGKNIEAKNSYQKLVEGYPHSKELVPKAKEKLSTMNSVL